MKRWQVRVYIGVFFDGGDYLLGDYRFLWLAKIAAWWELCFYPCRAATIEQVERQLAPCRI